jgi:ATP-dependent Lon protease
MPFKKLFDKISSASKKKAADAKNKLKKNRGDSDSDSESDIFDEDTDSSYEPPKSTRRRKNRVIEDDSIDEEEEDDWEDCDDEDGDEDDDEDEEDDPEGDPEGGDDVVNRLELQKFLSKLFPSKYMQEKVESSMMDAIDGELANKKPSKSSSKNSRQKKSKPIRKRRPVRKEEEDSDDDDDEEDLDEEEGEDEKGVYSILFMGGGEEEEDEEFIEDEEGVELDSDDEQAFMKETYEKVDLPEKAVESVTPSEKKKASKKKAAKEKAAKEKDSELTDVEQEYLDLVDTKKQLSTQLVKRPTSKILRKAIKECDESIKKLVKKARTKNAKTYHELIHGGKKQANEIDYFKKNLSNKEQLRVMKDLKEINEHINIVKPYRLSLLDTNMPPKFKAIALQKLNVLKSMDPGDNEYYKIKNWVDTFMRVPFGMYKEISVKMDDGPEACHGFMSNAMTTLDNCVYGLNDAKIQIMQMIGQWIANPSAMGTAIAINGPPGTGKTSLIKEGISKILGREFAFIALGGAGDSSFLEGHSYTYEGSSWGKIVQIIIDSKCMNPVIYFDELDKISDTPRGEEIVGILTHLTDTSQNSQFHDKYFSEIDFDLSKCLFIFSYNDESKVNPILKDRMYRIQTKGYDSKEKVIIARKYILPKIREQVNFNEEDIIIPDETIQYIVSNTALTHEESGVRNLKRCLEIIHTKLNLFRLVKDNMSIFGKELDLKVSFPFTVTKKEVDILIKNEEKQSQSMLAMYC